MQLMAEKMTKMQQLQAADISSALGRESVILANHKNQNLRQKAGQHALNNRIGRKWSSKVLLFTKMLILYIKVSLVPHRMLQSPLQSTVLKESAEKPKTCYFSVIFHDCC
jgi:hypothetical protein